MRSLLALALAAALAPPLAAQQPAPAPPPAPPVQGTPLAVGADAPDFTLTAATREGVSARPIRLSELRDQTVVIAFFFRARTRG